MINNNASASDQTAASVMVGAKSKDGAFAHGVYVVECFDKAGKLKWSETADNLVVKEGAQFMNDTFFAGSAYSATWYIGLITGPGSGTTISADDTLASHAGWTEFTDYTGDRVSATFGDPATLADPSVMTTSAASQFVIDDTGTVAGAFLTDVDTGTVGILFSASDFTSPGDRDVVSGDTINVTYAFSLDQTP